ncbi:MAG TPA: creatininase family protein [Gemmatimonadaceae bacterium]|nr:creatininase family protein [Gemmatimonadaceae bacterium]
MPSRPFVLSETTWKSVKPTPYEVAILPWGATEPHNYHLPYGTDNYETQAIAERAAEIAWNKGAKVVVLPTVPFGVNTGQLDLKLALNMNPSTQLLVLGDIARAISGQGVKKLLVLNGHGGNDFRQMIRELQPQVSLFICTINWWTCVDGKDHFDEPGDHAGEMETSVMQKLEPDLVLPLSEAGAGKSRKFRIPGLRDGWAWAPRQWSKVTDDTGTGNPAASTAAKGEKFLEAVTTRIGGFLVDLAKADTNKLYE